MKKRILAFLTVLALLLVPAAAQEETLKPVSPRGMFPEEDGSMLVVDSHRNCVYRLKDGVYTLAAGSDSSVDGYLDGTVEEALFDGPVDIVPFLDGYAVSDSGNHVVRYLHDEDVRTLGGNGTAGLLNGRAENVQFSNPRGLAVDEAGNLYIADCGNHAIRMMDTEGNVSVVLGGVQGCADGEAGTARLNSPTGISWYEGALYICDSGNRRICVLRDGVLSTLAGFAPPTYEDGSFAPEYLDGGAAYACFGWVEDLLMYEDALYICDSGASALRVLKDGEVSTLQAMPSPAALLEADGKLWVSDSFSGAVRVLEKQEAAERVYTDVSADAPYAEAVALVSRRGLFEGMGDGTFAPEGKLDRAMFVTVVGRLYASVYRDTVLGGEARFSDVAADSWYFNSVSWAADMGITDGVGDGLFAPKQELTREQLAVLLYRMARHFDWYVPAGALSGDYGCGSWALEGVSWAAGNGILPAEDVRPLEAVTRAETAMALAAFLQTVLGIG